RPAGESASQSQVRQFAQPSMAPGKPRLSMPSGEFSFGWSLNQGGSGPGIAWDPGLKRKGRPNEDSVLSMRGTCNFAERLQPFELHIVADGMGGHAQGRLASHLAIRGMLETVIPGLVACQEIDSEQVIDILIDGVHWANQVIYQYGQEHNADMGTTITAALLLDESAYIINVGDSRTYIYRPGAGLTQITRDHSLVARMVETGAIAPEEIYTHPDRNKVYRGLGDKTDVTVDWFVLPVQVNDLLLLCSDGLWEMVRDPKIAEILQTYASSPTLASNALLRAALQGGGSDNVSTLVIKVG
ncbi:MAG TPA: protein phosphatase 2C domain-containing protein, partial [Ktedonobacteraceae bacterium]|nr:protein phosphatase 2C domain-containing protein [Ktedonobacteraceae bacterium]